MFGVTFASIAPEHPLVNELIADEHRPALEAFKEELAAQSADERTGENSEKKGVDTGLRVINPVNGDEVPLFAANFVLADYGTGAVMAVPAHDTRDFARQGLWIADPHGDCRAGKKPSIILTRQPGLNQVR